MKKIGVIVVLLVAVGLFVFQRNELVKVPKEPNMSEQVSVSETVTGDLAVYTLAGASEAASLIAEVNIVKANQSLSKPTAQTLFTARVQRVFKGETTNKTIQLWQKGTEQQPFHQNELFAPNDRYLLFLVKDKDGTYSILSEEMNTYKVVNDKQLAKLGYKDETLADVEIAGKNTIGVQLLQRQALEEKVMNELKPSK